MKRRVVYLDDVLFELYAINVVTWRNEAMDRIVKTMIDNMKKHSFVVETDSKEEDAFGGKDNG